MLCIFLAGHCTFRPFKRGRTVWRLPDADNLFETGILLLLTLLSIVDIVQQDVPSSGDVIALGIWAKLAIYIGVTIVSFAIGFHNYTRSWHHTLTRQPRRTAQDVCLRSAGSRRSSRRTDLRESLLMDCL